MSADHDTEPHEAYRHSPDLAQQLAELPTLDIHALRTRWRRAFRTAPPDLPRPLLYRLLAYRLQARAYGDLDRETARFLDQVAREHERRRKAGERRGAKTPPPVPPVPDRRGRKPGSLLVRAYGGTLHRVTILQNGFAWQGSTYKSLSEIARLITGTRWNGPRFFGLRDKAGSDGEEAP
jgi:hypothetical protein